jgi:hypothetical protein
LIVIIDADAGTVQDRLTQLDQALKDSGKPAIDKSERIARLVPKRNVETWILCLNDQRVDEETDYKRTTDDSSALIPAASKALHQWTQSESKLPSHCIDSLRRGIRELKRLEL